jgi:hypothetical protein
MVRWFTMSRMFADPQAAARRLLEHARAFEPARDGWISIEQLNHPFVFADKATLAEFKGGMEFALSQGWLEMHESDAFVRFTPAGAAFVSAGTNLPPDT